MRNNESMPSTNAQPIPQPHPESEQPRPKIWMGAKVKYQAIQSKPEQNGDYCDICTPVGRICPHTWEKFTIHLDLEESNKESNRDTDIEKVADYRARVPLRRPRQPPKVLIFQSRRLLVGWPCSVRPTAPPTSDQVP